MKLPHTRFQIKQAIKKGEHIKAQQMCDTNRKHLIWAMQDMQDLRLRASRCTPEEWRKAMAKHQGPYDATLMDPEANR